MCVLYAEESTRECTRAYVCASICLYTHGNLNQPRNSSRLAHHVSELFKVLWLKTRSPGGSVLPPPSAPARSERERERGGGTEKGDRWKGKRIPHLLSVVCSPKQAEWIIQRWCIIPKEPSANLQSCRCHVEELLRTPGDCLEGSRTVASSLNFLYVSISLIFLQFWKKLLCPWWFESK